LKKRKYEELEQIIEIRKCWNKEKELKNEMFTHL